MKSFLFAAVFLALFSSAVLANPPAIIAPQAGALAQKDLEDRALQNEIFIAEINYKKGSFGEKEHWEVLWSKSFPAQTEGRNEIGLKIYMDGNYTRSVR